MDVPWAYLLIVNVAALLLMGFDKFSAKLETERVPEMWFFLVSLAGGFVGVAIGMLIFHHKTRKLSFQVKIAVAAIVALFLMFLVTKG